MADDFVPEPDATEQRQSLLPDEADEPHLAADAPEADALEQAQEVPVDEEEVRRS
jgi:hypothetical protein